MDIDTQIANIQSMAPSLVLLTKPLNTVGDYLFFSHVEFPGDEPAPRYHFQIFLARKELRSKLEDIMEVLTPLMEANSDLFSLKSMKPIKLDGLFVVYQIDISVSQIYTKEDEWIN